MITIPGIDSYFGGKSGSGTYQTIINRIPPHKVFCSLFLGNCGITRHKRPAKVNILNDLDERVVKAWQDWFDVDGWKEFAFTDTQIGRADAITLLRSVIAEKYDTADCFIYLDPTYLMETRKHQQPVYRHEMTTLDHQLLLTAALELKQARIMISHYRNSMYDEYLTGWNSHDFPSATRRGQVTETIYYNYDLNGQLHDYNYIGEDFREREAYTRQVNNMLRKINAMDPLLRNKILQILTAHV